MGNRQNIIELNGNRYDAVTGKILGAPQPVSQATHKPATKSIDGFAPRKSPSRIHTKKVSAATVHAKPAKSKTLMRQAVKKPKIQATSSVINKSIEDFSARKALEEFRLHRAKKIPTSRLVSRFGVSSDFSSKVIPQAVHLPVRPEPVAAKPAVMPVTSAPSPTTNHLQKSIDQATSHTKKPLKKSKLHHRVAKKLHTSPKKLSLATTTMAVLLIAGFIAYQNASVIAVRVAAKRAGVAVTVPGYMPAGFRLSSHSTHPGQITIGYRSNSDARSYAVTQTISGWDSSALVENFLASNTYQATRTTKGLQVYLYNGTNATWVDHGVWFKIDSNANLSSEQLTRLIDSI